MDAPLSAALPSPTDLTHDIDIRPGDIFLVIFRLERPTDPDTKFHWSIGVAEEEDTAWFSLFHLRNVSQANWLQYANEYWGLYASGEVEETAILLVKIGTWTENCSGRGLLLFIPLFITLPWLLTGNLGLYTPVPQWRVPYLIHNAVHQELESISSTHTPPTEFGQESIVTCRVWVKEALRRLGANHYLFPELCLRGAPDKPDINRIQTEVLSLAAAARRESELPLWYYYRR